MRKDYILCGSIKIIKDFLYIFKDISVDIIIAGDTTTESFKEYHGIPLCRMETIAKSTTESIIVCLRPGEDRDKRISFLKKKFLHAEILPCEAFFGMYDETINIPEGHQLYVWGTGRNARQLMESYTLPQKPMAFIDTFKSGAMFYGKNVIKPSEVVDWNKTFVIVAVADSQEIEEKLLLHGLHKGTNFVNSLVVVYNPAKMLDDIFFSKDGYDFACDTMLNHLEIMMGGATRVCCTTFVKVNRVNFLESDFWEYWLGKKDILHRILALSTQNRSYIYCDKTMCPLFDGRKNIGADSPEILLATYHEIEKYPRVVACGFDNTCNLACETCRTGLQVAKGTERKRMGNIAQKIEKELLPHIQFLVMAGNGEVFLSPAYRKIWESDEAPGLKCFRLLTNGMLFNEKMWKKFILGKEKTKIILTVSIDAAKQETYESIRRFGDFSQLQKNMKFAGLLRKKGRLAYFRMNFVVQQKNIDEMEAFVSWGRSIGADKVFFTKILNWGTYDANYFEKNISVVEKDSVTPIPRLKKVLESPLMNESIVDLGTIRYAHQPNNDEYIKNYYMWELEKDVPGLFDDKQIF